MPRTVDRKYTFWVAGYYDDFIGTKVLPDEQNSVGLIWHSSKTHQGNPINGWASLNPRYAYAWCVRGDGDSAQFNNPGITTTTRYAFNSGVDKWLGVDENRRDDTALYEGLVQLQYPDSLTTANRQKFDGGTGIVGGSTKAYETTASNSNYAAVEGYMMFCNSYDTSKKYYAATGTNDSTFGRDSQYIPDSNTGTTLTSTAGLPDTSAARSPGKMVRTHLAGVYSGEVPFTNDLNGASSSGQPRAWLYPITSPAGKPFLSIEAYTTSSSYDPILSYDGSLNSKGDGDIFTIRIYSSRHGSSAKIRLRIGCEGTAFTSVVGGDTGYTRAAIDFEIVPDGYSYGGLAGLGNWSDSHAATANNRWDDYDFIMNYTAGTYDIVKNGASVSTNNAIGNTAAGVRFKAADMYGWELDAKDASNALTVLIDRVGMIRPLNDYPLSTIEMPPVPDFSINSTINSSTSITMKIIDDDTQLSLLSFFNQDSYSDSTVLLFRDNIDRPIWRGTLKSMSYTSDANSRTPTIKLTASDFFGDLDKSIPTWELGGSGEGDNTTQVAYNRSDSQNNLNVFYFGADTLSVANATLGFDEGTDGDGIWKPHLDSRMRRSSAHPIQMYNAEDEIGPNNPYADWDTAISGTSGNTAAQYRSLHSRWIKDLPKSAWFSHMFGKIKKDVLVDALTTSAFTVGSSTTITIDQPPLLDTTNVSFEIINDDGFIDHGVATSIASANNTTPNYIRFYQEKPSYVETVFGVTFKGFVVFQVAASLGISDGAYINLSGLSDSTYGNESSMNGIWQVKKFNFPSIRSTINGTPYVNYVLCRANGTLHRHSIYTNITSAAIPSGEDGYKTKNLNTSYIQISPTNLTAREIGTLGSSTIGYGGATLTIPTTNFLQRDHATGSTLRIRNIDDDFKHIWILWADMRNDGNANADASTRNKKFGLLMPYSGNYNLSLGISETNVSVTQERTNFVDLNLGEDIDLWSMDATADPLTGNPWSAVSGGSNSESNNKYHTWEGKAGAFVIIDTSKFFNLNTTSNNGRAGQASGGRKEVGDFLTETEGFPVLVDNYWAEAICAYNNFNQDTLSASASSPFLWTSNYKYLLNNTTTLASDIKAGDEIMQFNDEAPIIHNVATASGIPLKTGKTNRLLSDSVVISLTSEKKKKIFHALLRGKVPKITFAPPSGTPSLAGLQVLPYTYLDGSGTNRPLGNMEENQFCIDLRSGYNGGDITPGTEVRVGHKVTLSNFAGTTTTNLDGEYIVEDIINVGTIGGSGTNKVGPWAVFTIKTTAASIPTISAGTCHWELKNTYYSRALFDLGVPVPGTTAIGEWDGSGYSQTGSEYFDDGVQTTCHTTSFPVTGSGSAAGVIKITSATGWVAPGLLSTATTFFGLTGFSAGEIFEFTAVNTSTTPPQLEGCVQIGGSTSGRIDAGDPLHQLRPLENNAEYLTYFNAICGTNTNTISINNVSEDDATPNTQSANTYTDILVRSGLANIFPMRLLMSLSGFIESKGTGTWNDSDKIRVAYTDCLNKNWLSQSSVKGIPDIGTVPVTSNMATVYNHYIDPSGAGFPGQGGYISGIAAPSGGFSIVTTNNPHGLAGGETVTILSSPTLGFATGSQDYVVSDTGASPVTFKIPRTTSLAGGAGGRWRRASRIDNYGGVNDCRNESYASIYQSTQEKSGLGENGVRKVFSWLMSRDGKPAFRPNYSTGYTFNNTNLSVSNMTTSNSEQISNVRVFYAGNGSYVDYPSASLGTSPRWEILEVPEITSTAEATEYAKGQYEKRKLAPLSISAKIIRIDADNTIMGTNSNMISGARYGYIADQSRTIPYSYSTSGPTSVIDKNWAWNSLWGGNLFPGMVSALDGRDGDCGRPGSNQVAFNNNYWWYGSNSISYAVQVVHIPRNMPKSTQKTAASGKINADGRLRMVIDIVDTLGADVGYDNLEFRLSLIDYDWVDNTFAPTSRSITSLQFDANGYYEMDIPSTYWTGYAGEKMIVSLNYEYLKALVRQRCPASNYTRNGNSYAGKTHSTLNTSSIFPLGMRKINANVDYWGDRTEWYAPRLEITDDINFHAATNLIYTDAAMGINAEVLGIKSVGWSVSGIKETLGFTLERDISRSAKNLMSFFNTGGNEQGPWKPVPPPVGGTPGGVPLDPGAGQGGWPSQGGFGFVGGFGAIEAGTTQGSQFNPISLAGAGGNPIGTSMSSNSPTILNANNVGQGLNNNIKGTMDFNTDSITGGTFSVLGQRKPSQSPRSSSAIEGIDSFITPIAGDAVMGDDGMSFAGASDAAKAYTAFAITSRVPTNVINPSIVVTGRYTLDIDNGVAAVTVKVECVETGSSIEEVVQLNSGTNRFISLFSNNLIGLDVPNNTIKVTIGREAGTSPDTAQYASLVLHNVQIESDITSVSGTAEAQSYSFSA